MLPKTCLAMVQTAKRRLEKRSLPLPDIDDDSAILRVEVCGICGICGSEYEQLEDVLGTPMPIVRGHEPLGIIEKIGDRAARRWKVDVGDRVAVMFNPLGAGFHRAVEIPDFLPDHIVMRDHGQGGDWRHLQRLSERHRPDRARNHADREDAYPRLRSDGRRAGHQAAPTPGTRPRDPSTLAWCPGATEPFRGQLTGLPLQPVAISQWNVGAMMHYPSRANVILTFVWYIPDDLAGTAQIMKLIHARARGRIAVQYTKETRT